MSQPPIRALLTAEQRFSFDALSLALREPGGAIDRPVVITPVRSIEDAMDRARVGNVDLAFVDLISERVHPLDVLSRHRPLSEHVAMIALAPDDSCGSQAVLSGAYDYLVPSAIEAPLVRRVVRGVMERRRLERALSTLDHQDSLTGLLNRRGFYASAEPRMRLGMRGAGNWVISADVDALRRINARHGHAAGNEVLAAVAEAIKGSVRGSDVISRVGEDEFLMMLIDANRQAAAAVTSRIDRKLEQFSADRNIAVSLTTGAVRCEPRSAYTLDQLVKRADDEVLARKRG